MMFVLFGLRFNFDGRPLA